MVPSVHLLKTLGTCLLPCCVSLALSVPVSFLADVAYKPEELFVKTRKCEPDAGGDVVRECESYYYVYSKT
uniref:Uncharacterized protein n=1 Tax=Oryza brachyantha TaxID=4533 RepID=J3M5E5_ORYBR